MTLITLPNRPVNLESEDISKVVADFDAILAVLNGDLRDDNFAAAAALAVAKLAAAGDNSYFLGMTAGVPTWKAPPGSGFISPYMVAATTIGPVSVTATSEGASQTIVGPTTGVAMNGTQYVLIHCSLPPMTASGACVVTTLLYEDGAVIGQLSKHQFVGAYQQAASGLVTVLRQPSAASHTYTVKAFTTAGAVTFGMGNGGSGVLVPGLVAVERFN